MALIVSWLLVEFGIGLSLGGLAAVCRVSRFREIMSLIVLGLLALLLLPSPVTGLALVLLGPVVYGAAIGWIVTRRLKPQLRA